MKKLFAVIDADGSDVQALTGADVEVLAPSASPDGTMIAFTDINTFDVFVINADGSGQRRLTTGGVASNPNDTGWLPDGSGVVYLSDVRFLPVDFDLLPGPVTARKEVFVAPLDGSTPYVFGEIPLALDWLGNWSPDGEWLLVSGTDVPIVAADGSGTFPRGVFLVSAAGAVKTVFAGNFNFARFSPDGRLYYLDDMDQFFAADIDLTTDPVTLGEPEKLANYLPGTLSSLAWSPDGNTLALEIFSAAMVPPEGGPAFVYTSNIDGSNLQILVGTGGANASIAWVGEGGAASTGTTSTTATDAQPTAAVTSTCSASAASAVNLRSGAGTGFDEVGTLSAGETLMVIGQADGSDGQVWWQLETGAWGRSDVVNTSGDCWSVPFVGN